MKLKRFFLGLLSTLFTIESSLACTTFAIKTVDQQKILYKGLDRPLAQGSVYINKKNIQKSTFGLVKMSEAVMGSDSLKNAPLANWTSNYASVTFNQAGTNFPYGGINENYLVVEVLALGYDTEYPNDNNSTKEQLSLPIISEAEWMQYILDTAKNLEEVKVQAQKVQIQKIAKGLHYFICESSLKCMAVEYLNGQLTMTDYTDKEIPVLSNSPVLEQKKSVEQLKGQFQVQKSIEHFIHNILGQKFSTKAYEVEVPKIKKPTERVNKELVETLESKIHRRPVIASYVLNKKINQWTAEQFSEKLKHIVQLDDTRWNITYNFTQKNVKLGLFKNENNQFDLRNTTVSLRDIFSNENLTQCSEDKVLPVGFNFNELQKMSKETPELRSLSIAESVTDAVKVLEYEGAPEMVLKLVQNILKKHLTHNYTCAK